MFIVPESDFKKYNSTLKAGGSLSLLSLGYAKSCVIIPLGFKGVLVVVLVRLWSLLVCFNCASFVTRS